MDLFEDPERVRISSEIELKQRFVSTYKPLVGVIGRIVKEQLGLDDNPRVKFDMYPVRMNEELWRPQIRPVTSSRSPVFQITLPHYDFPRNELRRACEALRATLERYHNPWYRLAGFVMRGSRHTQPPYAVRRRHWLGPLVVYEFSYPELYYRAVILDPEQVEFRMLNPALEYGDYSDDDQEVLVDEMWRDVRRRRAQNMYAGASVYPAE